MSITPEICTHCGVPAGYREEIEGSRKLIEKIHRWFFEHDANLEIHNGAVILFGAELQDARIASLIEDGYESKNFPGEYVLLYHPKSFHSIRIYENGDVWEKTRGDYMRTRLGDRMGLLAQAAVEWLTAQKEGV